MADCNARPAAGDTSAEMARDTRETPTASSSGSTSAVRGASLLIVLQIVSRAATFVANQLLLRFLTAELLGVAAQLEVYYLSVLFFARESLRVAIQRQGGKSSSSSSSQAAINLAYVSVLLGIVVSILLGWLFRASVQQGAAATTPFLLPGLYLYAVAAVVELLSEPAFVVLQLRLQFGARAASESVATVFRCATTLGSAALFSGALGDTLSGLLPSCFSSTAATGEEAPPTIGVLPFALGQLVYGLVLLAVYAWYGTALARREGFLLFPRRVVVTTPPSTAAEGQQAPSAYVLGLFDRVTLHLATSMAAQSVVKHILTQGDMFLVSILSTPAAQGVYVLANNYGGLAARLLFQPIEESSRSYFSRLLAGSASITKDAIDGEDQDEAAVRAGRDLQALLRIYLVFSLVVTVLGPAAAAPFLGLVTGPRWAASGAAATLAAYVWYIPLLALNGVAEAFVASVATEAQVHHQSVWMGAFSLVFAAAGYACLRVTDGAAVGLVAANAINMACRIIWSAVFIRRYFAARRVTSFSLTALAPHPLAVLAAVVTRGAMQRLVVGQGSAAAAGAAAQIIQLAQIAAIGLPFVLVV